MTTVTVIAPIHNGVTFVEGFVRRMQDELHDDDRVIVIDDASTDGSADALLQATASDARFVLVRNETNIGVARSRNAAVRMAETEFVWFVDHDDTWERGTLQRYRESIGDADVLLSRADYRTHPDVPGRIVDGIDAKGALDATGAVRLMLEGSVHGYLWSKFFRRTLLGQDPFPPLSSQSDFCGVVAMLARASAVAIIPDIQYHYINRPGSITRGRRVNLDNFVAGRDEMMRAAERVGLIEDRPLIEFFLCWFFCHASVFVPVRQASPGEIFDEGMRRSRAALRGIALAPVFRRRPRTGAEMLLIRYGWFAYRPLMNLALRAVDMRKRAAERRSAGGN